MRGTSDASQPVHFVSCRRVAATPNTRIFALPVSLHHRLRAAAAAASRRRLWPHNLLFVNTISFPRLLRLRLRRGSGSYSGTLYSRCRRRSTPTPIDPHAAALITYMLSPCGRCHRRRRRWRESNTVFWARHPWCAYRQRLWRRPSELRWGSHFYDDIAALKGRRRRRRSCSWCNMCRRE
jgi:hypothetical protein